MTTMMIDDSDIFLNFNHNPSPLVTFNNIMRQYYDSNGNPIQQRKRNNVTNENRDIVSSVQPITKKIKREVLTLDLLLPKRRSSSSYIMREETRTGTRTRGTEIFASTTTSESKKGKDSFDIRNYITRVYGREQ